MVEKLLPLLEKDNGELPERGVHALGTDNIKTYASLAQVWLGRRPPVFDAAVTTSSSHPARGATAAH